MERWKEIKMNQYFLAFITGLSTGGLSCLAVQGGLLATAIEKNYQQTTLIKKDGKSNQLRLALPIILFLASKVIAYSLLGILLGSLGSVFQLNAITRSLMLIIIGIFMVGNSLRMLNIHPLFNIFAIEPPKFITRYIRKASKNADSFTPLLLGALTVFIPCGVTQAMIAAAIATASPIQSAGLMFAFTLGTTPVFFLISYLTLNLGARTETVFMRLVAVVILILGIVSIDSGLNLMGVPSIQSYFQNKPQQLSAQSDSPSVSGTLILQAKNNGYSPTLIHAKANTDLKLQVITDNTQSCARGFVIPGLNIEKVLPVTGTTEFNIPPQTNGTELMFTCSMGMYTGKIVFTN